MALQFHKLDPQSQIQLLKMGQDDLKGELGEWQQFVNDVFKDAEKEDNKLLKRIVWLEAALLKKVDKKVVKAEVKKQEKGLLSLIKKALSKKFKK